MNINSKSHRGDLRHKRYIPTRMRQIYWKIGKKSCDYLKWIRVSIMLKNHNDIFFHFGNSFDDSYLDNFANNFADNFADNSQRKTPLYCWQTSNDKNLLQLNAYKGFNWTHFRIFCTYLVKFTPHCKKLTIQ